MKKLLFLVTVFLFFSLSSYSQGMVFDTIYTGDHAHNHFTYDHNLSSTSPAGNIYIGTSCDVPIVYAGVAVSVYDENVPSIYYDVKRWGDPGIGTPSTMYVSQNVVGSFTSIIYGYYVLYEDETYEEITVVGTLSD